MNVDKDSRERSDSGLYSKPPPSDKGLAAPGCRLLSAARVTLTMELLSMDAGRQLQHVHQCMREGCFGRSQLMTMFEVSGFGERSNAQATSWTWAGT